MPTRPTLRVLRPETRTERVTIYATKATVRWLKAEAAAQRKATGSKQIKTATIAADLVEAAALAAERAARAGAGLPLRRSTDHTLDPAA